MLRKVWIWLIGEWPKTPVIEIVQAPPPPMTPGVCECSHIRSCHTDGTGKCQVGYPADDEWKYGASCACQLFILDPDGDDDDDSEDEPETPSPGDLEKLYRLGGE
jgi:hypothetical protein